MGAWDTVGYVCWSYVLTRIICGPFGCLFVCIYRCGHGSLCFHDALHRGIFSSSRSSQTLFVDFHVAICFVLTFEHFLSLLICFLPQCLHSIRRCPGPAVVLLGSAISSLFAFHITSLLISILAWFSGYGMGLFVYEEMQQAK